MATDLLLLATGGVVFWSCVLGTAIAAVLVAITLFHVFADKRRQNGFPRAVGRYMTTRVRWVPTARSDAVAERQNDRSPSIE
jgi:hypothetical protein